MDFAATLADAEAVISLGKLAIQVGEDAAPFVQSAVSILQGTPLTDDQRATLGMQEAALRAKLDAASEPNDAA